MSDKKYQEWEYIIRVRTSKKPFKINGFDCFPDEIYFLNEMGKHAWELAQAPSFLSQRYIFKRPKQTP